MTWYLKVLKQYADFNGRARRKEYWYFVLFNVIIILMLSVLSVFIPSLYYVVLIYELAILIPSIAVGVRRLHDVDKSGWFLLIPIYNLILECTAGTMGENSYGPDPKNPIGFDFEQQPTTTLS